MNSLYGNSFPCNHLGIADRAAGVSVTRESYTSVRAALSARHSTSIIILTVASRLRRRGMNHGGTMKRQIASLLTVFMVATTAFAGAQIDDHAKAKRGAVIGGVIGAIAGGVISNNREGHSGKRGAIVGGLAGTAAGAIVGAMMDKQERELRQIDGVNVTRTSEDELKVTVRNEVLF
ncbi:MAG: hypothetical protein ABIP63_09680, partial [Thermoanaerobaculia bacterium]